MIAKNRDELKDTITKSVKDREERGCVGLATQPHSSVAKKRENAL